MDCSRCLGSRRQRRIYSGSRDYVSARFHQHGAGWCWTCSAGSSDTLLLVSSTLPCPKLFLQYRVLRAPLMDDFISELGDFMKKADFPLFRFLRRFPDFRRKKSLLTRKFPSVGLWLFVSMSGSDPRRASRLADSPPQRSGCKRRSCDQNACRVNATMSRKPLALKKHPPGVDLEIQCCLLLVRNQTLK